MLPAGPGRDLPEPRRLDYWAGRRGRRFKPGSGLNLNLKVTVAHLEACSDSEVASEFSVLLRHGRRRQ